MPGVWFDHIGIACESNEESEKFWRLLGFYETGQEENVQQGVKIRFMQGKDAPPNHQQRSLLFVPDFATCVNGGLRSSLVC